MSRSLIFVNHQGLHAPADWHRFLVTIQELHHGTLPNQVLIDDALPASAAQASPFAHKTVHRLHTRADTVTAFLLKDDQDGLLVLGKNSFADWQQSMQGTHSKKTQAFAMHIDKDRLTTHINWEIHTDGRIHLPYLQADPQPVEAIRDYLLKKEQKIEDCFFNLFKNLDEEDGPHKIRVNARTLRSLIDFLRPFTDKAHNKALRNELKNLATDLSDIRELDVLMQQIAEFNATHVGSLAHLDDILEQCRADRTQEIDTLLYETIAQGALGAVPRLRQALETIDIQEQDLAHNINQNYYNDWITFNVDRLLHNYHDVEATHDLRKEAKRLRYILENLGEWIPAVNDDNAHTLKDIQTILGDLCDARVNQDRLTELKYTHPEANYHQDLDTLITYNKNEEQRILQALGVAPEAMEEAPKTSETTAESIKEPAETTPTTSLATTETEETTPTSNA